MKKRIILLAMVVVIVISTTALSASAWELGWNVPMTGVISGPDSNCALNHRFIHYGGQTSEAYKNIPGDNTYHYAQTFYVRYCAQCRFYVATDTLSSKVLHAHQQLSYVSPSVYKCKQCNGTVYYNMK